MERRAWTTFGVGRSLEEAWVSAQRGSQPPPAAATRVELLSTPEGIEPSKFGTEVERVVVDPGALTGVAPGLAEAVRVAAGKLEQEPNLALAVDLTGSAPGDRLIARHFDGRPGLAAYLIFGVGMDTGHQPSANLPGTEDQSIPRVQPEAR